MNLYLHLVPTVPVMATEIPATPKVTYIIDILVPTQNAFSTANIAYVIISVIQFQYV